MAVFIEQLTTPPEHSDHTAALVYLQQLERLQEELSRHMKVAREAWQLDQPSYEERVPRRQGSDILDQRIIRSSRRKRGADDPRRQSSDRNIDVLEPRRKKRGPDNDVEGQ